MGSRTSVGADDPYADAEADSTDEDDLERDSHGLSPLSIIGRMTEHERKCLRKANNKVKILERWILEAISLYTLKGAILTEPPIVSRIYQELSNGNLGHQQAMKIAVVPFPFAFAQILTMLLVLFLFFVPVIIFVYTGGEVLTIGFVFITIIGFQIIHEIAMELENPFGKGANDLPLSSLHEAWVEMIKEIITSTMPNYKNQEQFKQFDSSNPAERHSPRSSEGSI